MTLGMYVALRHADNEICDWIEGKDGMLVEGWKSCGGTAAAVTASTRPARAVQQEAAAVPSGLAFGGVAAILAAT